MLHAHWKRNRGIVYDISSSFLQITYSDLKKYENSLPIKRQELACSEKELKEVTKEMEVMDQSLRSSRGQVQEARSALQAHKSRWTY